MVIAGDGIVEGVDADVEDAEIRVIVFEKDFINRTRIVSGREVLWCHEMFLVEVSFAYRYKVQEDEDNNGSARNRHPSLTHKGALRSNSVGLWCLEGPEKKGKDYGYERT